MSSFSAKKLNRYEALLVKGLMHSSPHLSHHIAYACRETRLSKSFDHAEHKALYEMGANVAGPILAGYILWLLQEAQNRKIKRLYFLARDGQVLLEIARLFIRKAGIDLELRYLYASRQAWHLPAITKISPEEINWITQQDPILTLQIISNRLNLDSDMLKNLISKYVSVSKDDMHALTGQEIAIVHHLLLNDNNLQHLILQKAKSLRKSTLNYLKQEGLLQDRSWALVDMGWLGNLQESLKKILSSEEVYNDVISGFYFGLFKNTSRLKNDKIAYFFSPTFRQEYLIWGGAFVNILEIFTSADHGMTLEYKLDGNSQSIPRLKSHNHNFVKDGSLQLLRSGIYDFVERLSLTVLNDFDSDAYRLVTLDIIKSFYSHPSLAQARVLGDYLFSSDQSETVLHKFAPSLTFVDACRYLLYFKSRKRYKITFWIHGSRVRSNFSVRFFLFFMLIFSKLVPCCVFFFYRFVAFISLLLERFQNTKI
jgi:predicted HAD superfamily hydrolase